MINRLYKQIKYKIERMSKRRIKTVRSRKPSNKKWMLIFRMGGLDFNKNFRNVRWWYIKRNKNPLLIYQLLLAIILYGYDFATMEYQMKLYLTKI